jgi:arylsulfatase A-like enzyme
MTGRYCWRTKLKASVLANWEPPLIEPDRLTLPEMLRKAGYHTAGLGKWHLGARYTTTDGKRPAGFGKFGSEQMGSNLDLSAGVKEGPTERGFDRWYGFICASETLVFDQDKPVGWLTGKQAKPAETITNKLERMELDQFMPEIGRRGVEYIRGRAKSDRPFFLYFAPYVPHVPLAVEKPFRGKTRAGDYGDYVHEMDHYIGRLLAALEETGQADNTLILFASDNGSQFYRTGDGHEPNWPFSGRKHMVLEGGVRTPLIVNWPGKVEPDSTSDQLASLNDVMATLAALTGCELGREAGEDSFDLSDVLLGKAGGAVRENVVVKSRGRLWGLREGRWKYIDGKGTGLGMRGRVDHPAQLYDLTADREESKNLYADRPEVARRLKRRLDEAMRGQRTAPVGGG